MFKRLRIRIFNWFAAGRMTLTQDRDHLMQTTFTLPSNYSNGIALGAGPATMTGLGSAYNNAMNIKITPANGGTIIQVNVQEYGAGELYVIPDGTDFDRELGKIITVSKLKS